MDDINRMQTVRQDGSVEPRWGVADIGRTSEVAAEADARPADLVIDATRRTAPGVTSRTILQRGLARGITDEDRLTDLVFSAQHPERAGRPLSVQERQLRREWLDIRDRVVRPVLRGIARPSAGTPGGQSSTFSAGQAAPGGSMHGALDALRPLADRATSPTVANAVAILRPLARYWAIPWQLPFTILQHEGGVRLFRHHDGVMQTIAEARKSIIPALPRPLKLVLLGLPMTDTTTPDGTLAMAVDREFQGRLAVQIAAGTQELVTNLRRFNGYVALAFVGYNAGPGSAYRVATGLSPTIRPRPAGADWERACRVGATLLHQPPTAVNVPLGVWQCDANLAVTTRPGTGWHRRFAVRDSRSNRLLIAYQYLRSVRACIHHERPGTPCGWSVHMDHQMGSGRIECAATRIGALDKLLDPSRFPTAYRTIAQAEFRRIADDGSPLKVVGGELTKVAPAFS
jgi:hypothetical protein